MQFASEARFPIAFRKDVVAQTISRMVTKVGVGEASLDGLDVCRFRSDRQRLLSQHNKGKAKPTYDENGRPKAA